MPLYYIVQINSDSASINPLGLLELAGLEELVAPVPEPVLLLLSAD
jgi:hypothetical protein